ncbi:amino acid ABC transporter substrate-binding protein [Acuticoccus sediminis]|uniref:Amino acid ABC transporter substrate-binding protein n=1 Tax=Acuticoccus sediminis TaxID=2184697 RepID=A0A8B2NME6_9HYPH|nr:ABC transporter substrate-binding protein [Acuticoccus sediminis]RAH99358.1 amino acid ABC transporter substrate-binding protein [Acuticoccus sediminis]
MMKLKTAIAAGVLAALGATGASAQDKICIGYQLPLTGDTAQYGQGFRNAAEIQLEKFNASGKLPVPVEIIYEDSRSDAKEGVTIARKFVDNPCIVGVLGDFTSTVSMAAAQVYSRAGMPQLSQTASHPDYTKISEWQFRNITTQNQEGPYNADWMTELGIKKVAVIAEQTDWGQSVVAGFTKQFEADSGEVVFSEYFNRGLKDFRSVITKIQRSEPDAVYTGYFYEDGANFLRQMKQLGVEIPVFSTSAAYNPALINLGGDAVNGMKLTVTFLPTSDAENVKEFVSEYESRYGEAPGQFPAQAFDAVGIMLDAIVASYPDVTREKVRDALAATKDYPGVTGVTTFDENREPAKELTKAEVIDGAFVGIE